MTLEDRRMRSTPKWVNPCGLAAEDFATGDLDVVQLTDSQLLHQVVVQAKTALMHAELFRDDYVSTDCTCLSIFSVVHAYTRAKHCPNIHGTYMEQYYTSPNILAIELTGAISSVKGAKRSSSSTVR
ncbi:hypothetical protein K0M31_003679 [Melipona bicolor]|uniref:Uncharacterized protein n=1 Tax=Melipona bicolor TaxID=60889 RepID=A0AA40FYD9_9HYME|nr:hypothetical protein K0M31_003679 [Melipona bicolor]